MAFISMMYELPVTITAGSMPCLSHAIFTGRCSMPGYGYVDYRIRQALTSEILTGESLEHYLYLNGMPNFYESLLHAKKFSEARVTVQEKHSVKCNLNLEEEIEMNNPISSLPFAEVFSLRVSIEGQKAGEALQDFISKVGEPYFVANGSDYKLVDQILAKQGLKTKRKLLGCLGGKQVVPVFI